MVTADTAKSDRKRGIGAFVAVIVALLVVVGGVWAGAYAFADNKLPRNTKVGGVDIGNLSPAAAQKKLTTTLAPTAEQKVTVTVGSKSVQITPQAAGITLDAAGTVAEAGVGQSWNPKDLWNHYTGGSTIAPVVTVDKAAFDKALAKVNSGVGVAKKDGAVAFTTDGVKVTDAVVGKGVDAGELQAGLTEAITTSSGHRSLDLKVVDDVPAIDSDDVQKAVTEFANPAMSGPVTLTFGKSPIVLRPAQYAGLISLKATDGSLVPTVDATKFTALLKASTVARADAPVDATVVLRNGHPTVVPAKPGVSFDAEQAQTVFTQLLTKPEGQRTGTINSKTADPAVSTADAEGWKIKEKISSFTTYFPYAEYRNINIGRAAELVNGTIIKPGETFSLNGTVGERTRANGFTDGWTIQEGVFKSDLGGGVSQMATTTFNAAFFAGLQDVEHHAHSLYISRYPVGREATVAWGAKDLRFKNNTPYGVLIRAAIKKATPGSQGVLTVSMWSTKVWDITTSTGARYASTPYKKRDIAGDNCEATVGANGFQIDVKRYFHKPGQKAVVKTENFHTTYIPQDAVTCTGTVKNPA
ncbi:VanW family protein [Nocardioides sp.]|uniref:VanW family protein n=1 Tax=Nocardioides sp. TaxID=35761 RepID=UPI0026054BBD|nr:VanW family protein [Nocardioides sp.]